MSYLTLLRLREIASLKSNIIQKGKKYIRPGQKAPKGVQLHKGPQGGTYYLVEDKHMKIGGKHHELIRSKGVPKDQWDDIRQKHLEEGAESVEFIPQPDYGGKVGKKLYNIYVRRGDTDEKVEGKIKADKEKFAQRKMNAKKKELNIYNTNSSNMTRKTDPGTKIDEVLINGFLSLSEMNQTPALLVNGTLHLNETDKKYLSNKLVEKNKKRDLIDQYKFEKAYFDSLLQYPKSLKVEALMNASRRSHEEVQISLKNIVSIFNDAIQQIEDNSNSVSH